MKKKILIITVCLFCFSCGVKDGPEYKSLIDYNKIIHVV
jgi:hypothetical protein